MCDFRSQVHEHAHERTADWTSTLRTNTVMPEQTTESVRPGWHKYIPSVFDEVILICFAY